MNVPQKIVLSYKWRYTLEGVQNIHHQSNASYRDLLESNGSTSIYQQHL